MTKSEQMQELLEKRNGYLLSKDVSELGISKTFMSEFVKKHNLERVAQGVYMSEDTWQDDLYILSLKNIKAILSYDTALQIHELTEREPSHIYVTVPYTYNAKHLRDKGIRVHQCKDDIYEMGKITATTKYGNPIDRSNIWSDMKKLCKEAGVSEKKAFFHNLRHLFARICYTLQKGIVRLADILGHSSVNTTQIYTMETGEIHSKQIQRLGLLRC